MRHSEEVLRRSQELRRNMTRQERHLWYDFLKIYPVQFRRQVPVGAYYVDFLCQRAKVILELDGSQHCTPEAIAYDRRRTAYLEEQGFLVLRFSNLDVDRHFRSVCEVIDSTVDSRMHTK